MVPAIRNPVNETITIKISKETTIDKTLLNSFPLGSISEKVMTFFFKDSTMYIIESTNRNPLNQAGNKPGPGPTELL